MKKTIAICDKNECLKMVCDDLITTLKFHKKRLDDYDIKVETAHLMSRKKWDAIEEILRPTLDAEGYDANKHLLTLYPVLGIIVMKDQNDANTECSDCSDCSDYDFD